MTEPLPEDETTEPLTAEMVTLLLRLEYLRSEQDLMHAEACDVSMALEKLIRKSVVYTDTAGTRWRATVSRPDPKVEVDLYWIEQHRPELYERITKRVLNNDALRKAMKAGMVDKSAAIVAMKTKPATPSVRLTNLTHPAEETTDDD